MQSPRYSDFAGATSCRLVPPATWGGLRNLCITRQGLRWARTLLHCLVIASLVASCTRRPIPPPAAIPTRPAPPVPDLRIEYGLASWYGRERHGQRTASGEIYESDKLTAAHRTAPFGIYARVTNLTNGRTVEVRINDRGPAIRGRVLDLSYAAARQLDMVRAGIARVKVEWLAAPLPGPSRGPESFLEPREPLTLFNDHTLSL
jgi:rare lipoprotein A